MQKATTSRTIKAIDWKQDPHLDSGTKRFLQALNTGGKPIESMAATDARKVLENAQAAVAVDLSGIDIQEHTITHGGYTVPLHIIRPAEVAGQLPVFIFIHGGGWVLGDFPTHQRLVRDLVVATGFAAVFV